MAQAPLTPALAFVPAPADLSAAMLGLVLHRTEAGQPVAVPAHALAMCVVALDGPPGAGPAAAAACRPVLTGSATRGQVLPSPGGLTLSLLWRASVLPRLSGEPASTFTDHVFDAADLLGPVPVARWQACATGGPERQALLVQLVFDWARRVLADAAPRRAQAARFALALAAWRPQAGQAVPAGWSERQWQRACRDELGVHPGLLRRLARLHASVRAQSRQPARWADHALDAGYSDQAHLAREYRDLAGLAPTRGHGVEGLQLSAQAIAPRFFGA